MTGVREFGRSVLGRPLEASTLGNGPETTLFLAVHHGSEPVGEPMLRKLGALLEAEPNWLDGRRVVVVPVLNPDGLAAGTRQNANGVDLNRNLPTSDWSERDEDGRYASGKSAGSEPETQALMALVNEIRPLKIVTLHAPLVCVNWNGLGRAEVEGLPPAGPNRYLEAGETRVCAEDMGAQMAIWNGMPNVGDIGYPCPGSFGTWAGAERHIATITLEVGRVTADEAWEQNWSALLAALEY